MIFFLMDYLVIYFHWGKGEGGFKASMFFKSFITFLGLFFLNLKRIGDVRFAGQSNTASDLEP